MINSECYNLEDCKYRIIEERTTKENGGYSVCVHRGSISLFPQRMYDKSFTSPRNPDLAPPPLPLLMEIIFYLIKKLRNLLKWSKKDDGERRDEEQTGDATGPEGFDKREITKQDTSEVTFPFHKAYQADRVSQELFSRLLSSGNVMER
ncbi:HEAT repeat-containing protein 5A [Manis javanica]|nr:HEAT repeat-containing protein 5A [Manis javanica]